MKFNSNGICSLHARTRGKVVVQDLLNRYLTYNNKNKVEQEKSCVGCQQ